MSQSKYVDFSASQRQPRVSTSDPAAEMYKKSILIAALFASVVVLQALAGPAGITVEDLTRHLGIYGWATTVESSGTFAASLAEIVDGKIKRTLTDGFVGSATDPGRRRVAVLVNSTPEGLKMTLIMGGSSMSPPPRGDRPNIPLPLRVVLPERIAPGDYVLGGDLKERVLAGHIEDVKHGLALRIEQR